MSKFIEFNKYFRTNVPLFMILCVQTVLLCFDKLLFTVISAVLLFLMVLIVFCSYRKDVIYLIKKFRVLAKRDES